MNDLQLHVKQQNEELRRRHGSVPFEAAAIVSVLHAIYERLGEIQVAIAEEAPRGQEKDPQAD